MGGCGKCCRELPDSNIFVVRELLHELNADSSVWLIRFNIIPNGLLVSLWLIRFKVEIR